MTQPYATVITGGMAVVVALIALAGVLLTRMQAERHFATTHDMELVRGMRDRYATCAEQLAHASPAVRQAGVYALAALVESWDDMFRRWARQFPDMAENDDGDGDTNIDLPEAVYEDARICLDLLCAYLRSSTGSEDREVRHAIASVVQRHAYSWVWYHYDFHGADLSDTNLSHVFLGFANLSRANLSGADLRSADLRSADLTGADLSGAMVAGVTLDTTDLSGADLTGANFTGTRFFNAKLDGANLTDTNLTDADLIMGSLSGANLTGANLTRANLMKLVNLRGAELTRANLTDVSYTKATHWPEGFTPPPPHPPERRYPPAESENARTGRSSRRKSRKGRIPWHRSHSHALNIRSWLHFMSSR
ncbi:pentapeptide repeat-containing protein [Nocardia gamkensis]|uniref:pentapeptide repeat-containing protein n=1 Tax=Nocardia gamkensis TaxID=352869 RepID=UPI0036E5847A